MKLKDVMPFLMPVLSGDVAKIGEVFTPKFELLKPYIVNYFNGKSSENKKFSFLVTVDENNILALPVQLEQSENQTLLHSDTVTFNGQEQLYINLDVNTLVQLFELFKRQDNDPDRTKNNRF